MDIDLDLSPLADIHDEVMFHAREQVMAWCREEAHRLIQLATERRDNAYSTVVFSYWQEMLSLGHAALGCTVTGMGVRSAGAIARLTKAWALLGQTDPDYREPVRVMRAKMLSFLGPVDALGALVDE